MTTLVAMIGKRMLGKNEILGLAILAFLGSIAGLCVLGVDVASSIADGFVVAFAVGCIVGAWGLSGDIAGTVVQDALRDFPYQNVVYGTAASEVMELRQGLVAQDVGKMIDDNAKRLRGE